MREELEFYLPSYPEGYKGGGGACKLHVGPGKICAVKGRAYGGGYCKESGAVAEAFRKLGPHFAPLTYLHGTGMNAVHNALEYLAIGAISGSMRA